MIKTIVKDIIDTYYPDATFEVADNLQADIDAVYLESIEFPFILFDTVSFAYEVNEQNEQLIKESIILTFLQLDSYDNNTAQTFDIIEDMKVIALNICYKVATNKLFIDNNNFNLQKIVHDMSTDLSGVAVTFDLQYRTNQVCG